MALCSLKVEIQPRIPNDHNASPFPIMQPQLPNELLSLVFNSIDFVLENQRIYYQLCLTSSLFFELIRPLLYRSIGLKSNSNTPLFLRSIIRNRKLGALVHNLWYDEE